MRNILSKIPPWGWLLAIATPLRFINLGQENLWYDESFTAWLVRLDIPHMWLAIQGDVHPPLWYILEWINVRIWGYSEWALRLPSALLSLVAVLLVYTIAQDVIGKTAWLAGLLAAILPASLYYAQDARMYPLLSVFVLGMVYSGMRQRWIPFALAGIGALYTQNLAVLYVGCICLAMIISQPFNRRQYFAMLAIGIGWLPWLPFMLAQSAAVKQGFWIQPLTLGATLTPIAQMTMQQRVFPTLEWHVWGAALGITAISIIVSWHWLKAKSGRLVLAAMLGMPIVLVAISVTWRSIFLARALLPAALLLMIPWSYTLMNLPTDNRRAARLILIPALTLAVLSHYFPAADYRASVSDWAAPIKANFQQGDIIYYISIDSCILVGYYTQGLPYALMPHTTDLNQSLTEPTKAAMGFSQIPFDDLAKRGYKRVWFFAAYNPLTETAQFAELAHIQAEYPNMQLIKTSSLMWHGEIASLQSLYLVTL